MTTRNSKLDEFYFIFNQEKKWILIVSIFFIFLGIISAFSPFIILGSVTLVISIFILITGTIHFIEGFRQLLKKDHLNNILINFTQAGLDMTLGFILLNYFYFSVEVLTFILGVLFITDGAVQLIVGIRTSFIRSKIMLFCSSLAMIFIGSFIILRLTPLNIKILGLIIGIKLILFGLSVIVSIRQKEISRNLLLRAVSGVDLPKIPGGAYAAYFGGGFHTGIYVGKNKIVHLKASGQVLKTKFEDFFGGRVAQFWEYPDVKKVSAKKIISLALSYVGKKLPYKLLNNNCEHFVIYCLSGGKTTYSIYAQNLSSLINIRSRPFIGTFIEFYLRIIEWLVFNLGGKLGRRTSLRIRKMAAILNAIILSKNKNK